ncbi:MAG: OsmC family protein [Clostridia bacterium]
MQTYEVQLTRNNTQHVIARTREWSLTLGAKRGDPTAGFNPVETLLSALGACLLTAVQLVADLSHVPITSIAIRVTATRQDKPPQLVSLGYEMTVETPVPEERLTRLVEMAKRNSTVYQTLSLSVPVSGTVIRHDALDGLGGT